MVEEVLPLSTPHRRKSVYERLVLRQLQNLKKGRLEIVLPDGSHQIIGDGDEIHARIVIRNEQFFKKCVWYGDIGFGESYVDGDWDTPSITNVIQWFILNIDNSPAMSGSRRRWSPVNWLRFLNRMTHVLRPNTIRLARKNIRDHYDLSNEFFSLFLDPSMTYSSAYFRDPGQDLQTAQIEKYERLCCQLRLQPSDHVLEIGSGWGGFAIHAARKYGCRVTSITISEAQAKLARERVEAAGLEGRVEIRVSDYRRIRGQFDKIVSIEMLEAVGHRFLRSYFKQCARMLKPDGILAIQVITCPDHRYDEIRKNVDWIQKHIFPGSLLPSLAAIQKAVHSTGTLNLLDLKDMGLHYAKTLRMWREKFFRQTAGILSLGFDERFIRKWNYYFSYCEAAFAMRNISVVQLAFARPNCTLDA